LTTLKEAAKWVESMQYNHATTIQLSM
jgi:hypothetical protein